MLKQTKLFIYFISGLLIIWHLYTLSYSPLPWFDETFFASITHSLINGKGFCLEVGPLIDSRPIYIYGPIYFLMTSIVTSIFGFSIFMFRIVNFSFSIFVVILLYKILRTIKIKQFIIIISISAFCFDTIFLQDAHSGRMDIVALFFSLFGLYTLILLPPKKSITLIGIISLTVSLLTTPRAFVLVIPIGIYYLIKTIKNRNWENIFYFISIPFILFYIWIRYSYGTIISFFQYYITKNKTGASLTSSYLGGNLRIPSFQYCLIIVTIGLIIVYFKQFKSNIIAKLSLAIILFFYVIINDTGLYSTLIIPFYYIIIATMLDISDIKSKIYKIILFGILIINFSIFSFKSLSIVFSINERNASPIENWVKNNVTSGKKIIGDDRYFYAAIKNKCNFQYTERGESLQEVVNYQYNVFKPDYIFFSKQTTPEVINEYRKLFNMSDSLIYSPNFSVNQIDFKVIRRLLYSNTTISNCYDGTLYRIKY